MSKLLKFNILGQEAILLDGKIEVSVPDADIGSKIIVVLSNAVLDRKVKSIRVNMPNKIVFISAKDNDSISLKAEESNNKKRMN